MATNRNWVFTLNNYTDEELDKIIDLEIKYRVIGFETGESGTPHLQGMLCFKEKKSMAWIKKRTTKRLHLEVMKGTFKEASDYCKKDGDFGEDGTLPMDQMQKGEVEKSKWKNVMELTKKKDFDQICEEYPDIAIRYTGNILRVMGSQNMQFEVEKNIYIYGKSRVGKSTYARMNYSNHSLKEYNNKWFNYNGEEWILIEDIEPCEFIEKNKGLYKNWLDKWPFSCEGKGTIYNKIRPKGIIMTSNYSFDQVFGGDEALWNRVEVYEMTAYETLIKKEY
ncbi:MAG: putative viral replication protein [Cressdnaviricota sp.]|nr:MAG: putative viral replication protein [Cressdnaviricota sp.]